MANASVAYFDLTIACAVSYFALLVQSISPVDRIDTNLKANFRLSQVPPKFSLMKLITFTFIFKFCFAIANFTVFEATAISWKMSFRRPIDPSLNLHVHQKHSCTVASFRLSYSSKCIYTKSFHNRQYQQFL